MSDPKKTDENKSSKESRDNLFQIMDGIIQQLNITKKMFFIMIVTIMYSSIGICYYFCLIRATISV